MVDYYYDGWVSICCTAPPLFELHHEECIETIGICAQCKEHTAFEECEE